MSFGQETGDDLLTAIKRDFVLPLSQRKFTDDQLLAIAYEMLVSKLVPLLLSMDQGWYRTQVDQNLVANNGSYVLPQYSLFLKMHGIALVETTTGQEIFLNRIDLVDRRYSGYSTSSPGFPVNCYLNNNTVEIVPAPDTGTAGAYDLRVVYFRMPGRFVKVNQSASVLSVNYNTGQVTYSAAPPSTFTSSSTHDFYSGTYPFPRLANAITATNLAGAVQTFPTADVQDIVAGATSTIVDESIYLDIPYGLFTPLKNLSGWSLSKTQMDIAQSQTILETIMMEAKSILSAGPGNRIVSQFKKISQWQNGLLDGIGNFNGWWPNHE